MEQVTTIGLDIAKHVLKPHRQHILNLFTQPRWKASRSLQ